MPAKSFSHITLIESNGGLPQIHQDLILCQLDSLVQRRRAVALDPAHPSFWKMYDELRYYHHINDFSGDVAGFNPLRHRPSTVSHHALEQLNIGFQIALLDIFASVNV